MAIRFASLGRELASNAWDLVPEHAEWHLQRPDMLQQCGNQLAIGQEACFHKCGVTILHCNS